MAASEVAEVATQALKEAHGNMYDFKKTPLKFALDIGYPVPKWMNHKECESIVQKCLPAAARSRL